MFNFNPLASLRSYFEQPHTINRSVGPLDSDDGLDTLPLLAGNDSEMGNDVEHSPPIKANSISEAEYADTFKGEGRLLAEDERVIAERKLKRKLDMRLMPCIFVIFIMNYVSFTATLALEGSSEHRSRNVQIDV